MTGNVSRLLRPYLSHSFRPAPSDAHARAYCAIQRYFSISHLKPAWNDRKQRIEQLEKAGELSDYHPRLNYSYGALPVSATEFNNCYREVTETKRDVTVAFFGRVTSARHAGSKLLFLDLERQDGKVQCVCNLRELRQDIEIDPSAPPRPQASSFKKFTRVVRKGDWVAIVGHPTRTETNALSILATEVPQHLSPSLHQIPMHIEDQETLARHPHVNHIINQRPKDILRLRSQIIREMQNHLFEDGFIEVETPIIDVGAGGALARPFETVSNDLSDMPLKLRIAPELYLKRLVVAGHEKVFEIGRVFRNEGIDASHNPEFTICEFYEVGATLDMLMDKTEMMFQRLANRVQTLKDRELKSLHPLHIDFTKRFQRLEFIPTIEKAIGRPLPNLNSVDATANIAQLFQELNLPLPETRTLPHLIETLGEIYVEPLCTHPTFIVNHPTVISPLSKSFMDPRTHQLVAARCELFINGREYVNAYEEENSPFAQREKFESQLQYQADKIEKGISIDESYIEALEWGMPPTGGWGCGVDRLVMLFAGASRIADVLPFGTLKNVVALSQNTCE